MQRIVRKPLHDLKIDDDETRNNLNNSNDKPSHLEKYHSFPLNVSSDDNEIARKRKADKVKCIQIFDTSRFLPTYSSLDCF